MTSVARVVAVAAIAATVACNGGNNGGGDGGPDPGPPSGSNPCSSLPSTAAIAPPDEAWRAQKRTLIDGDSRYNVLEALAVHQSAGRVRGFALRTPARSNIDIGEIAVLQDEGDLIAPANRFDLRGSGVRFTRNGSGGYDARRIDGSFRGTLGRELSLTDDDTEPVSVPFGFPFYGATQTEAFVNSDGNVTFGEGDAASTARNISRLLTGPPRVAPFLADLDPSTGGRVFVNATNAAYTVTWCNVRGFDMVEAITTQVTLLPDGAIEFVYASSPAGLGDAVVGVSPGRSGDFTPVDLSGAGPAGGPEGVGERFSADPQLDTVAVIRKFFATHPDNYDQLILWTDTRLVRDAFAFETTIKNEIEGLGFQVFDAASEFGSAGRLRSYAVMDFLGKYPDDPSQRVLGEYSTLGVLAHEVGHRWLAFFDIRDHTGVQSDVLLGRDLSHWSFFFDSDGSVMEGNDIEDLGGGSFRTTGAASRYSLLDQYAMGLVSPSEVPPFFYVQSPTNVAPNRNRESSPQVGVTFNGTRRDVLIDDIIAINGPRVPSSAETPRVHRQAFLYISSAGRTPTAADIAKLDRIRVQWEPFFQTATDGRMQAITTLR
ncbi:MAG TPA: hypothetical protein VGD94_06190 [Vicinamibacterales bacterium]